MKNILLLLLLLIAGSRVHAADYYWVGGSGNWSDLNHWRLGSSSGSIPSIVPSSADNVFFDSGSGFTSASKTVSLDASAFCNNMTWGNVQNSPAFITTSYSFYVQIYGNLLLNATTYYQLLFDFLGNSANTITTGGTIQGQFGLTIDKGTGSLTVTDSLVSITNAAVPINVTTFVSGTFNIAGKKMQVYSFGSQNDNPRTLEMTNATVICTTGASSGFKVTGLNKTVHATGSNVTAFGYNTDEGIYNRTTITSGNGPNTVFVNNSTFKTLTFTATGYLYQNVGYNSKADTVIFAGIGTINGNDTIGYLQIGSTAAIANTGNVIGKMVCGNALTVSAGAFTNTVDSLILAPNRTTTFNGTFNINKYLYVDGAPCDAYTQIFGDSVAGTLNFTSGAVVDISNVILTGVKATGAVTPVAVDGVDGGGNAGFTITEPASTAGTTLYWVGGAGDWNDKTHWSFTSGGAGGACVPFKNDNVVFDANSGLAGKIVTTSGSSFCKDITWAPGVGATTFNESSSNSFRIYGSVTLQSTVTTSAIFEFYGSSAAAFTTNGGATANLTLYIVKSDTGSVTFTDNWNCPTGGIQYYTGGLNMAGRTITCSIFNSSNSYARNLDITNATINAQWVYLGANKTLASAGSHITSSGGFQSNFPNSSYPWVDLNATSGFSISGTTFGQLTFASTSVTSGASILNGNTIRRLEFKGAGSIANTGNNIDSLILAGSRVYTFAGTSTINKYMYAQATPCTGLTEMRGSPGTLAFQPGADVHIDNVYLQSMTATGAVTPIAINGADAGGNSGWSFTSIPGGARYWVGGAGDWNDNTHWSTASGGASGACIPTVSNDVYFDAASGFTSASKTVTVNNGNAYAHSVNWSGALNAPVWSQSVSWSIEVWGDSLILNPAATFSTSLTLKGATATYLKSMALGNLDMYIDKPGSSLTLLNNFSNAATDIAVLNGTLNASGLTLSMSSINNTPAPNNVSAINISNSSVTAGAWRYTGTIANHTLNATNSTINTATFAVNGLQYNTVNVTGTSAASATPSSATINRLTFTDPNTSSAVGINGNSNTIKAVEFKGSGGIYGTGNVMDTLIFFPGDTYTLNAGSNNTINKAWYGSGTPCHATQIVSSSTTANATITQNTGDVDFDYVRLKRITATGSAAPFTARSHSTDLGNNSNWNIAAYNGAAPIYGLGPDTAVLPTAFPLTLHTDGFFGAPSSQYTWNNSSTADSLLVPGAGTYSVTVSFPDGCAISDAITISALPPLAVTLADFTVKAAGCQSLVQWTVTDAENFSHFGVERSADGQHFTTIADLPYTHAADYAYTDRSPENGASYYRLKLADVDTKYAYSKTVSVNIDCGQSAVQVYPTVTTGRVQVVLPQVYSDAKILLYNTYGQLIGKPADGSGTLRAVDLDNLPAAVYLLQVVNGSEVLNFKIQKQ